MNNMRNIPSVSKMLNDAQIKVLIKKYGTDRVTEQLRLYLANLRKNFDDNSTIPSIQQIAEDGSSKLDSKSQLHLKPVINATGIIIHTNLGRAPLGKKILEEVRTIFEGYSNLEFDLTTGKRGQRIDHIKDIICELTGAEDAIVVNNNASAVYMMLKVLAKDREVLVSRGELVEIGGSFRVPDIMSASGAKMVEVGTTNRTHSKDYKNAINPETALIFRAHPSNYKVVGFTKEVDNSELAEIAHENGIYFVNDIGSGYLRELPLTSLNNEPSVRKSIKEGADLVSFSCDKLLGGSQGGIIIGKKELIQKLATDPLMRVLRVGKTTLAILSTVLRGYFEEGNLFDTVPVQRYLMRGLDEQKKIAEQLQDKFESAGIGSTLEIGSGFVGGGSVPEEKLETWQVVLDTKKYPRQKSASIHKKLMLSENAIVALMESGKLVFKCLTLEAEQLDVIVSEVSTIVNKG